MTDSPTRPPEHRWRIFAVCVAAASLTILDLSKVNVGLPSIETALGAGPTALQLIVAGYALAFGLLLVPAGRLGDLRSRRTLFLVGLGVFALASLVCALAPDVVTLAVARILQGASAGILMPQVFGLLQQLFQGPDRGRAFGLFGAIIGLSTAFGPTLGGLLIAIGGPEDGWRLLFWMNVPLVLILFPIAWRLLPRRQAHQAGGAGLDPVGIVLLGIAVLALMLPFVLTTGSDSDDPARWWWLVLFAASGAAFVVWERRVAARGETPVVDFGLLRIPSYRNGILVGTFYFAAMPATFLTLTLYLQQGLHLAPVFAGMVTIPFALVSAITSWLSGRVVDRFGRALVVGGTAVVATGFTTAALLGILLPAEAAPWGIAAGMLVAGVGGGAVISPNQTLLLADIPVVSGGVAGSIAQLGQRIGTAVGLAAATAAFYATLTLETGDAAELVVYHDAYRNAVAVSVAFVVAALVFGLLDLRRRRHAAREAATL
ncbi:MFS transporter [Homoserinibacter sp. YIM 151385]|uniref:MFS transporter n=1 Tax=Homoserinibacter sp. YIM 151385 TaxID=2985506 RepID=UPI0022F11AA8|nr:MFS transporter [Homoserinibacter sp. YIM 151385]WBU38212.1 MFS transporter [Homoserinibacter sp. YIM 151385]